MKDKPRRIPVQPFRRAAIRAGAAVVAEAERRFGCFSAEPAEFAEPTEFAESSEPAKPTLWAV